MTILIYCLRHSYHHSHAVLNVKNELSTISIITNWRRILQLSNAVDELALRSTFSY